MYNVNGHEFRLYWQRMYARLGIDRFAYRCVKCGVGIFSEYDFIEEKHTLSPPKELPSCQSLSH